MRSCSSPSTDGSLYQLQGSVRFVARIGIGETVLSRWPARAVPRRAARGRRRGGAPARPDRSRPRVSAAAQSALRTASSVASTVAAKISSSSVDSRRRSRFAARRDRDEDLTAPVVRDRAGSREPEPARRATRSRLCDPSGASVATTAMQLPAGAGSRRRRRRAIRRPGPRQRGARAPTRSSRARGRRPCPASGTPARRADPAFPVEAHHPGTGADAALSDRARARLARAAGARPPPRPGRRARRSASCRRTRRRPGSRPGRRRPTDRLRTRLRRRRRRRVRRPSSRSERPVSRSGPTRPIWSEPVSSPAPFSTATPAASGGSSSAARCAGTIAVTPVRATPRPAGGSGSSRQTVTWPTRDAGNVGDRVGGARLEGADAHPELSQPWAARCRSLHAPTLTSPARRDRLAAMALSIPVVWSDQCLAHEPGGEIWIGVPIPGDEVPAAGDADPRDARSGRSRGRRGTTAPATSACSRPRRAAASSSCDRLGALGGSRATRRSRPGPRRPVHLPAPWPARRDRAAPARVDRRRDRALLLRHDDADRAGDLGGRPSRGGLRADRLRSRCSTARLSRMRARDRPVIT